MYKQHVTTALPLRLIGVDLSIYHPSRRWEDDLQSPEGVRLRESVQKYKLMADWPLSIRPTMPHDRETIMRTYTQVGLTMPAEVPPYVVINGILRWIVASRIGIESLCPVRLYPNLTQYEVLVMRCDE